jgi:hypothetical protein
MAAIIVAASMFCGCQEGQVTTGFLSDYSKLRQVSDNTLRYLPPGSLVKYTTFMIDPVVIHFHAGVKGTRASSQDKAHLKQYMYAAVRDTISDRYAIVAKPGPGVARIRIAITDIKESQVLQNIMPMLKVAGTGLGGASMEAELVDSKTGQQIAAVVETQTGNRLSFDGLSKWGDAEAVMKGWAQRFRKRLDEAHGH